MSKPNSNAAVSFNAPQAVTPLPNAVSLVDAPAAVEEVVASAIQLTPAVAMDALCPAPERKRRASKPGRPYYAAQVLRQNGGLSAVIDDKLADAVDLACGKPNRTESLAWLKIAQQICSGWENGKGVDVSVS